MIEMSAVASSETVAPPEKAGEKCSQLPCPAVNPSRASPARAPNLRAVTRFMKRAAFLTPT